MSKSRDMYQSGLVAYMRGWRPMPNLTPEEAGAHLLWCERRSAERQAYAEIEAEARYEAEQLRLINDF